MEINQIKIKHPNCGEILINTSIPDSIQERIGDVVRDYSEEVKYYHAKTITEDKEKFVIKDLCVITEEPINIGFMHNSKGIQNFITVITNRLIDKSIDIYPSAVMAVSYKN